MKAIRGEDKGPSRSKDTGWALPVGAKATSNRLNLRRLVVWAFLELCEFFRTSADCFSSSTCQRARPLPTRSLELPWDLLGLDDFKDLRVVFSGITVANDAVAVGVLQTGHPAEVDVGSGNDF